MSINRIIRDPNGKGDIYTIVDGEIERVGRRTPSHTAIMGVPSNGSEFFTVPMGLPDEMLLRMVDIYERGHGQGWRDGQWKLRRDIRELIGVANP